MSTVTITREESKLKNKSKQLKEAVGGSDLKEVLDEVKKVDNTCCFVNCKARTRDFAITCDFCHSRFCTAHGLPEIHGCGEAVRRAERRKFLHPPPKVSHEKHEKAATKLSMKLKQMQLERKPKPAGSKTK